MSPRDPKGEPPRRYAVSVSFLAGLVLLAFLLASAAERSRPGPRLSRKGRLVDLIRLQDQSTAALRRELDDLKRKLALLEANATGSQRRIAGIRRQVDALAPFAGVAAISGPGVRVTLNDSKLRRSPTGDPNDLVIHEQDLQAVVNALWQGGAEGIAVNGERITALSAIRCVGNTLLLHGSVYSPPYVVTAIGSVRKFNSALSADVGVERLRIVAEKFKLGYSVDREDSIVLPAFRGLADLRYAQRAP